ncbi:hypothetical protein MUK42_35978 [Musa troglodytarum]|uniref:Uncharacterized protein n=1 Tax=Musa troglodytarum TaxID=320322 RepID=A0A9E7HTM4_9LILI|nr:hypothetical protein MUK42_35978 [Musa troglodytarum]
MAGRAVVSQEVYPSTGELLGITTMEDGKRGLAGCSGTNISISALTALRRKLPVLMTSPQSSTEE